MNKQELASRIWESANKMRSNIEASKYKNYILGFIFYKYLSETEVKWLKDNDFSDDDIKGLSEDDSDTLKYIQNNIGYFISYDNLYSSWINLGMDFDVSNVTDALSAFSRLISQTHKNVYENIFKTLETSLTELGDTNKSITKAIRDILYLIKDIPIDGKQGYDVLGFIYEYLIGMFAANAGKKAGEFYTPHEVSILMSEIVADHLKSKKEIKIYDPTSGSGSLLITIGHCVCKYINDENKIKYYAQEKISDTYNLARMNLIMRGIKPDNIVTRNADTLEEDWPTDNNDDPLYVDAVVSNPPYSNQWDPSDKETDPRFSGYGLAPKNKADYAFLLHELYHLKPDGILTIVLPHGVLFRGGSEEEIRRNLIENNNIDAIIGLPANIFFGTGIATIIMILKKNRDNNDVLIIDASKYFTKEGKNNKLRPSDIKRISDTVINRVSIDKFSRVVSLDEIKLNDYNLNIPRYVDSSDAAETWDIYASMFGGIPNAELDLLNDYWSAFPNLRNDLFKDNGTPYAEPAVSEVKKFVKEHKDVVAFEDNFRSSFSGFDDFLKDKLLDCMQEIVISQGESEISDNIFKRLKSIPIIDRYEAYQILDDYWAKIVIDLENIQTEGYDVIKKVDPLYVTKKIKGREQEVLEGYIGRVIPFELVQKTFLSDKLSALNNNESRLNEITLELEEIADSLSDEENEGSYCDKDKKSFVSKEVTKKLKELKSDVSEDAIALYEKLNKVEALLSEDKSLKSEIKKMNSELEMLSKEMIENLSDENIMKLLRIKWIDSLINDLYKMPHSVVDNLIAKIEAIHSKYAVTFFEVEDQIKKTELELSKLIDELEGSEYDMKGLESFKNLLTDD